jgi:calpain-15
MAASAGSTNASKELLEKLGLIGNHSYGILDVREVKLANGKSERLLKLRNPWGDFEWNGDWGDDSDLWTPELEK